MSSNKVRKKGHLICPPEFHAQSGYFLIPSLDSVFHCIGQPLLLLFFLSFFLSFVLAYIGEGFLS